MPKCEDLCEAIQRHNNLSPCPYHRCLRSWSWSVLWRPRKSPRINTKKKKKKMVYSSLGLECKLGSQEISGITGKFGLWEQNEAQQRLAEFCHENALVIANPLFQQHERWLYTWTSPNNQYPNHTDYILCSQRWTSCIQSAKTIPGADCGSDHQLLIGTFSLN